MRALRILVVEDDALLAMVLGELLVGMGHTVCETVSTQATAVAAVFLYRPDLMIVDRGLSEGDGVSAVDEIHCAGLCVPHVFVSGDPGQIRAHRPDAVVVRKPFRLADLVRAMEAALGAVNASQGCVVN